MTRPRPGASTVGVALVATIAATIAAACGAASQAPRSTAAEASAPSAMGGVDGRAETPREEIERLDRELATARDELGLADPATTPEILDGVRTVPMAEVAMTCAPPTADTCRDACTLADAICDSATRICTLAEQLAGDTWADGRCTAGKASCRQASERCCGCS